MKSSEEMSIGEPAGRFGSATHVLHHWIAALRASLSVLEHAMACDAEDITACPHFRAAIAARSPD